MDNNEPVLRAPLEDCFMHFINRLDQESPPGTRGSAESRRKIATFCHVNEHAVRRWRYTRNFQGQSWHRLCHFLMLNGYQVIEYERMNISQKRLSELLGYSVVAPEDLTRECGYTETSRLFTAFRYDPMTQKIRDKWWEIWEKHKEACDQQKPGLTVFIQWPMSTTGAVSSEVVATPVDPEEPQTPKGLSSGFMATAKALQTLLGEVDPSANASSAEAKLLRSLATQLLVLVEKQKRP